MTTDEYGLVHCRYPEGGGGANVPCPNEPARVLPSPGDVSNLLFELYDHGSQPNAMQEAHAILALFAGQPTVEQVKAEALREHRRRVVRFMPAGLVNRATVLADLDDYADRLAGGGSDA